MAMMKVDVYRIPMSAPDDVSGLKSLLDAGKIDPQNITAVIGKTEGNGGVNDFTRGFAIFSICTLLSERLGIDKEQLVDKVAFNFSGGCEGVMSPHMTVFVKRKVTGRETGHQRLAIGVAFTRNFLPEEIGTMVQVRETAKAVREAMKDAEVENPKDVHFVQVKGPLLTSESARDAKKRGKQVVTTETYLSMGYSNSASALGVALALGECTESQLSQEIIQKETGGGIRSEVGTSSSGWEKRKCDVVVLGNSSKSISDLVIGHGVMKDCIDPNGAKEALRSAGLKFECCPTSKDLEKVVAVFAKGWQDVETWTVRGRRITIPTDTDFGTRMDRAVENAVIASVIGDPMIWVSGAPDFHQGGLVATIVRA